MVSVLLKPRLDGFDVPLGPSRWVDRARQITAGPHGVPLKALKAPSAWALGRAYSTTGKTPATVGWRPSAVFQRAGSNTQLPTHTDTGPGKNPTPIGKPWLPFLGVQ